MLLALSGQGAGNMTTRVRSLPMLTAISAGIMLATMTAFNAAYLGIGLGDTIRLFSADGPGAIPWMAADVGIGLMLAWFSTRTNAGALLMTGATLTIWLVLSGARGEMAQTWSAPASVLWHSDASSLMGSVASGASVWMGRILLRA